MGFKQKTKTNKYIHVLTHITHPLAFPNNKYVVMLKSIMQTF